MKRFWIGAAILLILLGIGLLSYYGASQMYPPITDLLNDAADNALRDDLPLGVSQALEAKQLWDAAINLTATIADHTPMEEIDHMFRELLVYAQAEEAPHFAACCAQIASKVQDMGQAHQLNLWNLF